MGAMERRGSEKEQRRNDIIDAAEKVFFAKGVGAATMEEVADTAGLSKGTIYLYFKNKEDLYLAIILRGLSILQKRFEEALSSRGTGLEQADAIGRAFFDFCKDRPDYFTAIIHFDSGESSGALESGYAMECAARSNRVFEMWARSIDNGVRDGSIRADIDPMETAMILHGASVGILQAFHKKGRVFEDRHGVETEKAIETFFEFTGRSLRPQKG